MYVYIKLFILTLLNLKEIERIACVLIIKK